MISRQRLHLANRKAWRRVRNHFYDDTVNEMKKYYFRYRKVTKRCSGVCCGNPRKHFGELTRQERRANEALVAQLDRASDF